MLLTSFSKHSVLIPRGQSVSAVTGGVEYFREDRQHTISLGTKLCTCYGQRYHVDRHGQLTLKQLRLSVLNEMHTNSYSGPRLLSQELCALQAGMQQLVLRRSHYVGAV